MENLKYVGCYNIIKFYNILAKEAIINALKNKSMDLFEGGGLLFRCFVNLTEVPLIFIMYSKIKTMLYKKDLNGLINFGKILKRWVVLFQEWKVIVK